MTGRALVLFVHQSSDLYGSDKVLLYLVTGLLARGMVQPVVVVPGPGPLLDKLRGAGVEVHVGSVGKLARSTFSPIGALVLLRGIWRGMADYNALLAGRRPVAVHSNTVAVLGGAAWAIRHRVPHLWHVHELILTPRLVSRAFPWLLRLCAARVVAISSGTAQWLLAHQPALAARTHVVFNGLPPSVVVQPAAVQALRRQLGVGPANLLVVLMGRLNHWKGQGLLIQAVALLRQQGQLHGMRFAIVGDAAEGQGTFWQDSLAAQAVAAGVAHDVVFLPFTEDVASVWAAADIAVVPSTEPEPFGMVAIEAMQAGVAVVAAAHGGLLDIIEHNASGLLVAPRNAPALADALAMLAADAGLRQRLGSAGKLRQQRLFSAEAQVATLEHLYLDMAGHAGARQPAGQRSA